MPNTFITLFFIVFFVLLAGILALVISISVINAKYKKFVLKNSKALKDLKELNAHYNFNKIPNFDMAHTYDNENFYGDISCQDYLTYELVYKQKQISKAIKETRQNKIVYQEYKQKNSEIAVFGHYQADVGKMKTNKLVRIESSLFNKASLKPQIEFTLYVLLRLEKINGQYRTSKHDVFIDDEIEGIIWRINQKQGSFYTNREIWDSICRVERGKVTNKMRFAIYARDGYRCCRCGRKTNDLEIDHIYPIAKGGKTTMDNLQTLCHRCNVGKGDSVDY